MKSSEEWMGRSDWNVWHSLKDVNFHRTPPRAGRPAWPILIPVRRFLNISYILKVDTHDPRSKIVGVFNVHLVTGLWAVCCLRCLWGCIRVQWTMWARACWAQCWGRGSELWGNDWKLILNLILRKILWVQHTMCIGMRMCKKIIQCSLSPMWFIFLLTMSYAYMLVTFSFFWVYIFLSNLSFSRIIRWVSPVEARPSWSLSALSPIKLGPWRPFRAVELWKEQCTRAHTGHTERFKTCRDTRSCPPDKVLVEMSKAKPVQAGPANACKCAWCSWCACTSSYSKMLRPTDLLDTLWFRVRLSPGTSRVPWRSSF